MGCKCSKKNSLIQSIHLLSSNGDTIKNSSHFNTYASNILNDNDNIIFQLKEVKREERNSEKFLISYEPYNKKGKKIERPNILLEVIHVDTVKSTMPSSRDYIMQGNKLPFIYNTKIQTEGSGRPPRKWFGTIVGNLYTSSCIPENMIKNELNDNDILVKITAVSIFQQLIKYNKDAFKLKYPNDILCVEHGGKLGGILVQNYCDFQIIGFGINIVDKPDIDKMDRKHLSPCFVNAHLKENNNKPNAIDLSIEVTKQIIINLNLTENYINQLFEEYLKK
jgi:biotin-(acetyl-CoA carboxylase) ligase